MKCGRRCGKNISVHNTPASASTAGGELVAAAGWEVRQHGGGKAVDARGQEHRQQGQEVWQHIDAEAPSRAGELMTSARKRAKLSEGTDFQTGRGPRAHTGTPRTPLDCYSICM